MSQHHDSHAPEFSDYPLRVSDVAKLLSFHPQYVRWLAKQGRIPGVKICGSWRFSKQELQEHLISYENSPATMPKTGDDLLS